MKTNLRPNSDSQNEFDECVPENFKETDNMICSVDSEAATKHAKNNVSDKVLMEFKEDLKVTMAFCTALKIKLDDIYATAFPNDDVGATNGELTWRW